METQLNLYRLIIMVLLVMMIVTVSIGHLNLLEHTEEKKDLEEKISVYDETILTLEKDYYALLDKYNNLADEEGHKFTKEEVVMLAKCVQAEAGDFKGHSKSQKYVAQVVLNRLNSKDFPSTIEQVIYQKSGKVPQFSVAYNGAMEKAIVEVETLLNVYEVLVHGTDLPKDVLYFYSDKVTGNWVNTRPIYKTVEGTVFAY